MRTAETGKKPAQRQDTKNITTGPSNLAVSQQATALDPLSLTPEHAAILQRTLGNRTVSQDIAGQRVGHDSKSAAQASWKAIINRSTASGYPVSVGNRTGTVPVLQRWNVAQFRTQARSNYDKLIALIDGSSALIKSMRLGELAELTDSPIQLYQMLLAMSGEAKGTVLLALLRKVDGIKELLPMVVISKDAAELGKLIDLEGNTTTLLSLHKLIKDKDALKTLLTATPGGGKGTKLLTAINRAGDYTQYTNFKASLTADDATVQALLFHSGSAINLNKLVPHAKDGVTTLRLLELTDVDTAEVLMQANAKADAGTLIGQLAVSERNQATVDCTRMRFTQATCTNQGDGYTVNGNIDRLKKNPGWDIPANPIRVFLKTPDMNAWGSQETDFGTADPAFLENGKLYTLDNRRLAAYQKAGRTAIPQPQLVPANVVKTQKWKFTTTNQGTDIGIV